MAQKREPSPTNRAEAPVITSAITAAIAPDVRNQMIATAAYYRAEHRGFCGGDPLADWLESEAAIDRVLRR